METIQGFSRFDLDSENCIFQGMLPADLLLTESQFQEFWNMHPKAYTEILMHGRQVLTPRWQQAYGRDYRYTGQVNKADPVPPILEPLLRWGQSISESLNGVLVNWYDGALGHYIGKHRDSRSGLVPGTPIVTISFGEERTFRLRPHKGDGKIDFAATNGAVFIMPWMTNLAWTHEVPNSSRNRSRRISITLRAFGNAR